MHGPPESVGARIARNDADPLNRFPGKSSTEDSGGGRSLQASTHRLADEIFKKPSEEAEHTLGILRLVHVRLGSIRDTIADIGICLKNDRITPGHAHALADEVAPGCFAACAEDVQ